MSDYAFYNVLFDEWVHVRSENVAGAKQQVQRVCRDFQSSDLFMMYGDPDDRHVLFNMAKGRVDRAGDAAEFDDDKVFWSMKNIVMVDISNGVEDVDWETCDYFTWADYVYHYGLDG